jgi:hypothetical protein
MGAPTSSYTTAGIALRVSGTLKPHHHDKVETPSVGIFINYMKEKTTQLSIVRLISDNNNIIRSLKK